ncbi:GNAT family N-acetyltransferase [Pseudogulbenkiania ferrooxidans]|uniref:GCN5-related N-acetyltransferase n=1 Tax=Pseudogulbenkiania ferrooxidans 2002 TaxID=279714 RepID=B9YY48_9NEIS|nr:GNAT family N-acetyltransferase [Pseudogulbenkiania ferrooxidans]EEG10051.1 GCN5-related N-acetyltransferase [Pseudogulbenkiania ferrooxidans 2002]
MSTTPVLLLRPARAGDIDALATLSGELGYPCDPTRFAARCATLLAAPEQHFVGVVEDNGAVCGWIHAFVLTLLEADPTVEIGGLVIGANWRGQGLGAMLLDAGEQWARQRGIASVSLRSAEHRHDAHRFYLRQGYQHVKNQLMLRKTL